VIAADANTRTIKVVRGKPDPALKIFGQGAAPLVRVTGPGGQLLDSTDSGLDRSADGTIRILRYQSAGENFTVVGLEHAKPGTYTVATLPGSVPFTTVESATNPPTAKVSGRVSGTPTHRVLSYRIAQRRDQTVTFWDISHGNAGTVIGRVSGGGSGRIRFAPAPGSHRRTIVAQFTLAGLPAERVTVATYKPPPAQLPSPRRLRVTRHKTRLAASWRPVSVAKRYEVVVTSRDGFQRLATTRGHAIILKRIPLSAGGRLTVRAVDRFRQSVTTGAPFKRLAASRSAFGKLEHCKVRKRRISCTGGSHRRHTPAHHRHKPARRS
jgi:hypothetical protein